MKHTDSTQSFECLKIVYFLEKGKKLADGDTRRDAGWWRSYRTDNLPEDEKIKEGEDDDNMCFLTEVRSKHYAYEGHPLIVPCSQVKKYKNYAEKRTGDSYGGHQVSFTFADQKL